MFSSCINAHTEAERAKLTPRLLGLLREVKSKGGRVVMRGLKAYFIDDVGGCRDAMQFRCEACAEVVRSALKEVFGEQSAVVVEILHMTEEELEEVRVATRSVHADGHRFVVKDRGEDGGVFECDESGVGFNVNCRDCFLKVQAIVDEVFGAPN